MSLTVLAWNERQSSEYPTKQWSEEKKLSRHWSADLPGSRKSVCTQCKNKVRHYGSHSGHSAWKCIAHLIQHGAHRTTVSPFPVFIVWTQGRYRKEPATHRNGWFTKSGHSVFHKWIQIKNCVVYFVRFWIIFDLSCIFITFTSISITQGIWRSLRGCVTGWFL